MHMFGKKEIKEIREKITKRNVDIVITLVAVGLGVFLGWENVEVMIFSLFIWSVLNPIPSRYFALGALFFLSLTPFMLILKRDVRAEEFAIYAYYFLVMTVIMGIYEMKNEKQKIA